MTESVPAAADVCAIVLAAGSGDRCGEMKQFALAGGRRLVDHVVDTARQICASVIVVLPSGHEWTGVPVTATVTGGHTRTASVRSALTLVPAAARVIVIHDAAHPLASPQLFQAVIAAVRAGAAAAIPALRLSEPLKRVENDVVVGDVAREAIRLAQTPHAFRTDVLRAAHELRTDVAEDTILVEALGRSIVVVPGDPRNIHVVAADELQMVRCLIGRIDLSD